MRTSQALTQGIHPRTLYKLRDAGELIQIGRGVYRLSDIPESANLDLAIVAIRVPQAVICLISALSFFDLTTEIPHQVYIALPGPGTVKARQPHLDYPPLKAFRFSGAAYTEGIETHVLDGISTKIYSPAKTIADCFKFRNQIGLDVALEALKLYRKRKDFKVSTLLKYARICHVEKVITPYLEAIG
jgi:predicted transcriptional regulator of viral defense system